MSLNSMHRAATYPMQLIFGEIVIIIIIIIIIIIFILFFLQIFYFLPLQQNTIQQYKEEKKKNKKNITYNLNITYSPNGIYTTTTTIKINTNKPNITYYKHMHVTVIKNTSILCYGERKENGNITMQTPAF